MPGFAWTALDAAGKTLSGTLDVRSKLEVYRELERQSLHPVSVREATERETAARAKQEEAERGPMKLKRPQLILFTEELADLLDAGMQLEQALRIMVERQADPAVKHVSSLVREDLREGGKFSKALAKASPSFDDLYLNLVAAGEVSGSLPEILRRLGRNIQLMGDLQSRVTGALIYPAALVVACIALVFVASTVMIPRLSSMISKTSRELPAAMEVLIAFSNFMSAWWWMLLIVMIVLVLSLKIWISTPKGRFWWDRVKLKLPLAGGVITARYWTQFAQSLGSLVSNGVPLLNGLKLMGRATSNLFLRENLSQVITMVAEGTAFSTAMRKVGHFPAMMMDLVAVGEQTGNLPKALRKAGERTDKELTTKIDRVIKLVTPVVLIFMAIVVGVVAFAIVSTLLQSVSAIRSRT